MWGQFSKKSEQGPSEEFLTNLDFAAQAPVGSIGTKHRRHVLHPLLRPTAQVPRTLWKGNLGLQPLR